jgi:hypothetical protein
MPVLASSQAGKLQALLQSLDSEALSAHFAKNFGMIGYP